MSQIDAQRWVVDQWSGKDWSYVGVYSSQSSANAAVAALVPQVLAAPTYYDALGQLAIPDPAQSEIEGA